VGEPAAQSGKLNVFISYSRDDLDFADQLDASLQLGGFDTTIDRRGISGGEDWKARLSLLISDADTVVFVLSPASARSEICAWEVAEAVRLGKRVIPVVCRALVDAKPPRELADRDYIYFYAEPKFPGSGFGPGLRRLAASLNTDLDWLREHTRYLRLATEWEEVGKPRDRRLLSTADISLARAWEEMRPSKAPELTALQRDFISASEAEDARQAAAKAAAEVERREAAERTVGEAKKAAAARKRVAQVAVAGFVIAMTVAALALWQYSLATTAKKEVLAYAEQANARLREVQVTQSRLLADEARQQRAINPGNAVLLSLEALPDNAGGIGRPYVPEAELQLDGARRDLRERLDLGHEDSASSATFSPDGTRIVTASWDKTARVWDAATGKPIGEPLAGHGDVVRSAAFSPDGKRIVTASWDKTARVWDAATGKPIGEPLAGHGDIVNSATFSPDGTRIVTASWDKTARVWDAATGKAIGEPLKGHDDYVWSAAFSPDGARIVTASSDRTARVWDAATGKAIGGPLKGHRDIVNGAAFSPDGKRIVTASSDKTARIWDAASGKAIAELRGHDGAVESAAFSPDGKRIVTASWDKTARVSDAESGKPIGEPLKGHEDRVNSAAFSPDGTRIVTASSDKTARVWDAATVRGAAIGKAIAELRGHDGAVQSVAFSPDGTRIVSASSDKTARVWDAATGKLIGEPLTGHEDRVGSAAFSPDGQRIVTASQDRTARIWDAATGKPIGEPLKGHELCRAPRSAQTASASSPRLPIKRRASGTPRPAVRSASRSQAMRRLY
jgi:WD40 repeat protein